MPPLPRLRIGPLADVAARSRTLAAEPARRMLERTEALAASVEPEKLYPLPRILADLRGERAPALTDDDSSVVGAALLADLPALAEHLSAAAKLDPAAHAAPAWLDAAALCKRWGVSRSTLDRYRKRGLVARRIEIRAAGRSGGGGAAGRGKLVFATPRVEAFESRHRPGLERAQSFTRISREDADRMLRRAARYRRVLGWSTSRAAERIAEHFGRSHEAVRLLLLKRTPTTDDAAGGGGRAGESSPVHARERAIIARAARWGVPIDRLAERFGRSEGSIYRSLVLAHAERLGRLRPAPPAWWGGDSDTAAFEAPSAPKTFLDHASVQTNLGRPAPTTLAALLALVEADEPLTPATERALARAYGFLRHRAGALIALLPRHNPPRSAGALDSALVPGARAGVDEIETILRWAARVKAELVRTQLPLAVGTIEAGAERPLASLTPAQAAGAYALAIGTIAEAVERHDPFKAGRLAAQAGMALNRTIAAWWRSTHAPSGSARAGAARLRPTAPDLITLDDFTLSLCPWQRELDLAPRLRHVLASAAEPGRTIVARRMGWQIPIDASSTVGGGPPASLAQIGQEMSRPIWRIARLESACIRSLIAAARAGAKA